VQRLRQLGTRPNGSSSLHKSRLSVYVNGYCGLDDGATNAPPHVGI
jgi:hypothetical protein